MTTKQLRKLIAALMLSSVLALLVGTAASAQRHDSSVLARTSLTATVLIAEKGSDGQETHG